MATLSVTVHAQSDAAALSRIDNARGQSLDAVFSMRAAGFTPLELQAAALAACIDASIRIAARQQGLASLGHLDVTVEATKAEDAPSRLGRFEVAVRFADQIAPDMQARLVRAAEDICTISNTLRAGDAVVTARAVAPDTAT